MLEDVLKSYRKKAEEINWKQYNKNELFFKCIENENDPYLYNAFYAGIVCRWWGYAGRIYLKCNKHVPFEECYDCVLDAINYVLKKRVWENPSNSLYKDKTGPDKAMHIALKRQLSIVLSKRNAKRRLSNFNTLSIDEAHENYNDSADGLLFSIEDESNLKTYISLFFEKDQYLEGVLLDTICYSGSKVDQKNIIKYIKSLTFNDIDYYVKEYNLSENKVKELILYVMDMSPNYLKIKLNSLLYKIKKEDYFIND